MQALSPTRAPDLMEPCSGMKTAGSCCFLVVVVALVVVVVVGTLPRLR